MSTDILYVKYDKFNIKTHKLFLNSIPKNQRSLAYCTAMKYGSPADWKFLSERYEVTNIASEQIAILSALGCSRDTKILEE